MKLTRRVLAVIISAAMLLGMVAMGVSAATATSLTTYGTYSATENPYQVKIGLKAFRTDDSGEAVEITDGKVLPGEVIDIQVWGQTNYHTMIASFVTAYSNSLFAATKLDGTTYDYDATAATGLGAQVVEAVPYDEAAVEDALGNEGDYGASYDTPYPFNAVALINTSFAGANNTTALTQAYNGTGVDSSKFNVVTAGYGPDVNNELPGCAGWGASRSAVITSYEPLFTYKLTVAGDVGETGSVVIPESAVASSTNKSGALYVSAAVMNALGLGNNGLEGDDAVAEYLATYQTIASSECDHIKYADTYADGATADRVVDLSEGTINFTVVESLGGEEPPVVTVDKTALKTAIDTLPAYTQDQADEATWAAYAEKLAAAQEVYNNDEADQDTVDAAKDELLAAIAAVKEKEAVPPTLVGLGDTIVDDSMGFIYGLPHADLGGVYDVVAEGYAKIEGDGTVECTPANSDMLGSGSTVVLKDSNGDVVKTYYVVIFGDTNGDAMITTDDLVDFEMWNSYLDSEHMYEDFTDPCSFAMDLDASGDVSADDALYVDYYSAFLLNDIYQTYQGQDQ